MNGARRQEGYEEAQENEMVLSLVRRSNQPEKEKEADPTNRRNNSNKSPQTMESDGEDERQDEN